MSSLHNLVYVSQRAKHCDEQEIKKILDWSVQHNPTVGVTGVLLHTENRFMQYLEGDNKELLKLFDYIKRDKRHSRATILYNVPVPKRVFPNWQMGYRDLDKDILLQAEAKEEDYELFRLLLEEDIHEDIEGMHILKLFLENM